MADTITEDELMAKARELGTVGAATKWMRQQGLTLAANPLPPADRELPPLASGGLSAVSVAEDDEGDVDVTEETDTPGGLDYANLDFSQIKSDPNAFFKNISDANRAADERAAQSAKQLYEQGRQRIMEKYTGPSQSEQFFALSRAMLAPRKVPGFGGFLGQVTGALDENAQARRKAEQAREEQLFNLQQQYQQADATRAAARPKTALELAKAYAAATKATAPVRGIAVGNRLVDPTTNMEIEPPVGTIKTYKGRKYAYMGGGDQYDQSNWKEVR